MVGFQIRGLGVAIQIGRNGQFADAVEHFGPTYARAVPREAHFVSGAAHAEPFGAQGQCDAADSDGAFERAFFPFFQITDHAGPRHRAAGGKRLLIVERGVGFEAKHLD